MVAEELGAEVVSADAMLVYRGMDIGTAKPTSAERARVPHHVVDLVRAGEEFSVARFQPLARGAIADVLGRGRVPLLVGGLALLPGGGRRLRVPRPTRPSARLEAEAAQVGLAELHRLAAADLAAAARVQPGNLRRTVRALEVIELTGRPFSSFRAAMDNPVSCYRLTVVGLTPGTELPGQGGRAGGGDGQVGIIDEVLPAGLVTLGPDRPAGSRLQGAARRDRAGHRCPRRWEAVVSGPAPTPAASWPGSGGPAGAMEWPFPPGPERVARALERFGKG